MKTSIIFHSLFNEFSSEQLAALMELAREFDGSFRIVATGIQIYDISKEAKASMMERLPEGVQVVKHKAVNSVISCRGTDGCSHAFMQTMPLAKYMDSTHFGEEMPNKIRIGISGCPRCCAETMIKDIGVYGMPDGFVLVAGGKSGGRPQSAEVLLKGLSAEEAQEKMDYLLNWYKEQAMPKEKFEHVLERLGNPFAE
ncbi:MAG: nitrite reductase [Veillonella sp.]|uniref:nitrite reductase n=1 Tax=Veillonella sp. TaxID=1926307 RepID=UPI0025F79BF2|nr:nitrite reductase [Veillonella sp.]MBS4912815.1 nitrite reductase [Veillonella sp.]